MDKLEEGCFVEIESIDRNGGFSNDELRIRCLELKEKLGLTDEKSIQTRYLKSSLA